ncbi:hypothetical protein HWV62_512 [Athelia sp. TMB]|nr:hypothetical protein HWV62_512 [Athelia sp. TMB]
MFSSRIIPFLFLVATFGLFAYASPVEISSDLQARAPTSSITESSVFARCDCTCDTAGCNEQAILTILTNLQATINVSIGFLDGVTAPGPYATAICTAIGDAVTLLGDVDVNLSEAGSLVGDIVNIIVAIILALATCVSKYGLVVATRLALQLDASLQVLVKAVIALIPDVTALLSAAYVSTCRPQSKSLTR